jgi:phage regulator Rha-like protein
MNDIIVEIIEKEPVVRTVDIWKNFCYASHKNLREVIENRKERFERIEVLRQITAKPQKGTKGGRPESGYILSERQFITLVQYVHNSESAMDFKDRITDEFFRMREELKNIHSRTEILEQYKKFMLLDAPNEWVKLYPPEFYQAIMRLYNQAFTGNNHTPPYCGQITRRWVYDIVLPPELRDLVPSGDEVKRHQWFTEQGGRAALTKQIDAVTGFARACQSRVDFEARVAAAFLGQPLQLSFWI